MANDLDETKNLIMNDSMEMILQDIRHQSLHEYQNQVDEHNALELAAYENIAYNESLSEYRKKEQKQLQDIRRKSLHEYRNQVDEHNALELAAYESIAYNESLNEYRKKEQKQLQDIRRKSLHEYQKQVNENNENNENNEHNNENPIIGLSENLSLNQFNSSQISQNKLLYLNQKIAHCTESLEYLKTQGCQLETTVGILSNYTHYHPKFKQAMDYIKSKDKKALYYYFIIILQKLQTCLTGAEVIVDGRLVLNSPIGSKALNVAADFVSSIPGASATVKVLSTCLEVASARKAVIASYRIIKMLASDNRNLFLQYLALASTIHNEAKIMEIQKNDKTGLGKTIDVLKDIKNKWQQLEGGRLGDESRKFVSSLLFGIQSTPQEDILLFSKKRYHQRICQLLNMGFKHYSAHQSISFQQLYETQAIVSYGHTDQAELLKMEQEKEKNDPVMQIKKQGLETKLLKMEKEKNLLVQKIKEGKRETEMLKRQLSFVSEKVRKIEKSNSPDNSDVAVDAGGQSQQRLQFSSKARNRQNADRANVFHEKWTYAYEMVIENKKQLADVADTTIEYQQKLAELQKENEEMKKQLATKKQQKACCAIM